MRFFATFLGMAVAVLASALGHVLAFERFMVDTCARTDRPSTFPADASLQGWACGVHADEVWQVPGLWFLGFTAVFSVALVVALWLRGGGWPWLSPLVLVGVPLLALLALGAPPDTCSADAERTHPEYACWTHPHG